MTSTFAPVGTAPSGSPNRNFNLLWLGEGVSVLGNATTSVLLPLLAVTGFGAGPGWMGALTAAAWLPWLVIGLPAGAWIDRLDPRRVMITADLIAAAALVTVPIAALVGLLSLPHLVIVALAERRCHGLLPHGVLEAPHRDRRGAGPRAGQWSAVRNRVRDAGRRARRRRRPRPAGHRRRRPAGRRRSASSSLRSAFTASARSGRHRSRIARAGVAAVTHRSRRLVRRPRPVPPHHDPDRWRVELRTHRHDGADRAVPRRHGRTPPLARRTRADAGQHRRTRWAPPSPATCQLAGDPVVHRLGCCCSRALRHSSCRSLVPASRSSG